MTHPVKMLATSARATPTSEASTRVGCPGSIISPALALQLVLAKLETSAYHDASSGFVELLATRVLLCFPVARLIV